MSIQEATDAMLSERTISVIANLFEKSVEEINLTTNLLEDLGACSMDLFELTIRVEEELHLEFGQDVDEDFSLIKTVQDVVDIVKKQQALFRAS